MLPLAPPPVSLLQSGLPFDTMLFPVGCDPGSSHSPFLQGHLKAYLIWDKDPILREPIQALEIVSRAFPALTRNLMVFLVE